MMIILILLTCPPSPPHLFFLLLIIEFNFIVFQLPPFSRVPKISFVICHFIIMLLSNKIGEFLTVI